MFSDLGADLKPAAKRDVDAALAAAHALPLGEGGARGAHGDLRPPNVLVRRRPLSAAGAPGEGQFQVMFM